jgi:hypothetical protein
MTKLLTLLISITICHNAIGQSISRAMQEKAYAQAIKEFLTATHKRDASVFDTLLVGRHPDFPAISLPARIGNTTILLCTTQQADSIRKRNEKLAFVNIVGTVAADNSRFLLVTFYPGYVHQYDCKIDLRYNSRNHTYQSVFVDFKNYAYK